ncbi:MAG TPA: STAS domain-containing protein [Albitalea sp.]
MSQAIEGELTIYRVEELHAVLREAIARDPALELDLAGVTEFDGAGVQLLLAAKKAAPGLRLARPSPAVLEVFELLDLAPHFAGEEHP